MIKSKEVKLKSKTIFMMSHPEGNSFFYVTKVVKDKAYICELQTKTADFVAPLKNFNAEGDEPDHYNLNKTLEYIGKVTPKAREDCLFVPTKIKTNPIKGATFAVPIKQCSNGEPYLVIPVSKYTKIYWDLKEDTEHYAYAEFYMDLSWEKDKVDYFLKKGFSYKPCKNTSKYRQVVGEA